MIQLIKSEIKYNLLLFIAFSSILLSYTVLVSTDFRLIFNLENNPDALGGVYNFILIIFVFVIWSERFREKRERMFALIPLSEKAISLARFWFASIPFMSITIYLLIVHLTFFQTWHDESSSMLLQTGILFILFAGFIRGRDDWFSHRTFGKRMQTTFVSILIIQALVVVLFVVLPGTYKRFIPIFGEMFYHYVKIIFFILGLIIMITTIFSYRKRKSYLG